MYVIEWFNVVLTLKCTKLLFSQMRGHSLKHKKYIHQMTSLLPFFFCPKLAFIGYKLHKQVRKKRTREGWERVTRIGLLLVSNWYLF